MTKFKAAAVAVVLTATLAALQCSAIVVNLTRLFGQIKL